MATRHRQLGWVLITLSFLILLASVALVMTLGTAELAARLLDPDMLMLLVLANIAFALARLASSAHAWWALGGRHWLPPLLLALVAIVPHAGVAWAGLATRSALIEVFAPVTQDSEEPSSVTSTTVPRGQVIGAMAPNPFAFPAPSDDGVLPSPLSEMTVPTTIPATVPFGGRRLNLLLLGGDAGPGRSGLRTDTIIVASIDSSSGAAALFSLPRNWGGLAFSDGTPYPGSILNTVYSWGVKNPEIFGGIDPGASALRDVVQSLTGLSIDYFFLVDLTGFADLIDVLDGVTINVPRFVEAPLYDPETGEYELIHINPGVQTLNGAETLGYVRARRGSSDYARMARQRCVLAALAETADPLHLFSHLPQILETAQTHITTDFPLNLVSDLIRLAGRTSADEIRVIGFDATWGDGRTPTGAVIPEVQRVREAVRRTLVDPESATELGVTTADEACG